MIDNKILKIILKLFKKKSEDNTNFINNLEINTKEQVLKSINVILEKEYDHLSNIDLKDKDNLVKILISLVENGYLIEDLSEKLNWFEFEYLCMKIFQFHNYNSKIHYRFINEKKRYEFDILCFKKGHIITVDAKRWSARYGKKSSLKNYALKQNERTIKFIRSGKLNEFKEYGIEKIYPIIITLYNEQIYFYDDIPIIPIYNLNNFLNNIYNFNLRSYDIEN